MPRTRFSIAGLMGFVLIVALGIAGLKAANAVWATCCFTLAFVSLGAGLLLAIQTRGRKRAFWLGFSIMGGLYFGFIFYPAGIALGTPRLLTTVLLDKFEDLLFPNGYPDIPVANYYGMYLPRAPVVPPSPDDALPPIPPSDTSPFELEGAPVMATQPMQRQAATPTPPDFNLAKSHESFLQIGESLVTLLVAYCGGLFSLFLAVRGERREAAVTAEVSPTLA